MGGGAGGALAAGAEQGERPFSSFLHAFCTFFACFEAFWVGFGSRQDCAKACSLQAELSEAQRTFEEAEGQAQEVFKLLEVLNM